MGKEIWGMAYEFTDKEVTALGAWVAKKNRKFVLRISLPPPRRSWLDGLFSKFESLKDPWNLLPA